MHVEPLVTRFQPKAPGPPSPLHDEHDDECAKARPSAGAHGSLRIDRDVPDVAAVRHHRLSPLALRSREPDALLVARGALLGAGLLAALLVVVGLPRWSPGLLTTLLGIALVGTVSWRPLRRFALQRMPRRGGLRKLLIVGCGPRGARLGSEIAARPELGFRLVGWVDDLPPPAIRGQGRTLLLGRLDEVEDVIGRFDPDEVLVALPLRSRYDDITRVVTACEQLGVIVRLPADFVDLEIASAGIDALGRTPTISLQTPRPSREARVIKRALDVAVSLLALLVLLPVFPFIALAIALDSKGPVFFFQERVGLDRRIFRMVKFRTMEAGAEDRQESLEDANESSGAAFKIRDDPRVTRLGRFLRKFCIDELPQFWNVLRGDMSLVGPRPLPVRDYNLLRERPHKRRFSVKPGLTCLWQIRGRHELTFEHWMALDLLYIDSWSLWQDVMIMVRTVPAVIRCTGSS